MKRAGFRKEEGAEEEAGVFEGVAVAVMVMVMVEMVMGSLACWRRRSSAGGVGLGWWVFRLRLSMWRTWKMLAFEGCCWGVAWTRRA